MAENERTFLDLLANHRGGALVGLLNDEYKNLVASVRDTGKAGVLTLTLRFGEPSESGAIPVTGKVKCAPPVWAPLAQYYFPVADGGLQLDHPKQAPLFPVNVGAKEKQNG